MEFHHTSVLLEETVGQLNIRPDGTYVDGTLGGGGHAQAVLERLADREHGRLIGFDQDGDAVAAASERLRDYAGQFTAIRANFADMREMLGRLGIAGVDGIVLDLGVSSFQLDAPERGFAYSDPDAPLDMRMDQRQSLRAYDIVNGYSEDELARIFRDYGEERFARQIARRIAYERNASPIATAGRLNEIVKSAIKNPAKTGGHPSKRVFQAIRIECNRELEVLRDHLGEMIGLLNPHGRICVISFHSLEDRIVKTCFKTAENPCICPPDFPVCVCGRKPEGFVVTKKPILPDEREIEENPRSKSAKLRVFEKA